MSFSQMSWRKQQHSNNISVLKAPQTIKETMKCTTASGRSDNRGRQNSLTRPPGDKQYHLIMAALSHAKLHTLTRFMHPSAALHPLEPACTATGRKKKVTDSRPLSAGARKTFRWDDRHLIVSFILTLNAGPQQ